MRQRDLLSLVECGNREIKNKLMEKSAIKVRFIAAVGQWGSRVSGFIRRHCSFDLTFTSQSKLQCYSSHCCTSQNAVSFQVPPLPSAGCVN